jgi:hypothetical protein
MFKFGQGPERFEDFKFRPFRQIVIYENPKKSLLRVFVYDDFDGPKNAIVANRTNDWIYEAVSAQLNSTITDHYGVKYFVSRLTYRDQFNSVTIKLLGGYGRNSSENSRPQTFGVGRHFEGRP